MASGAIPAIEARSFQPENDPTMAAASMMTGTPAPTIVPAITALKKGSERWSIKHSPMHPPYPIGSSIDTGGFENHCGPFAVMWKQSSMRTPIVPGR